jgi:hypothetical protein
MLFWDAHGFDVAECILGGIMPLIKDKKHVVMMHDISDTRYASLEQMDYKGNRLWRGNNWQGPRLMIGTIDSCVEQSIAILDFTTRTGFICIPRTTISIAISVSMPTSGKK